MELFFFPNSSRDLHSDAHHSQIIGGDADEDHTQIVGGDTVKLLGGIYPPTPPPGFGTPVFDKSVPSLLNICFKWCFKSFLSPF